MKPDRAVAFASPLSEVESRMGIPPIAELLAERDELVKRVAPLRAKHGAGGTYQDLRKILLATVAQRIRAEAVEKGTKLTEAAIEDAAHASDSYTIFVTQATTERTELAIQENTIEGIDATIMRSNAVARYLASEAMLSR